MDELLMQAKYLVIGFPEASDQELGKRIKTYFEGAGGVLEGDLSAYVEFIGAVRKICIRQHGQLCII